MATKKNSKKQPKKEGAKKITHSTRIDGNIIKALPINEGARDKMLEVLVKSTNEDVRLIANTWEKLKKEDRLKLSEHYEVNGTEYIVSVFRGNREHALLCCPDTDKPLLSK